MGDADRESAQIAIQAALTDHLVLSTLHTNDAPAAAARLVDMGVEPYVVASALGCVVAQRLARRLCSHCRVAAGPGLGDPQDAETFEAGGCEHCRDSGYHGRVGLFEIMTVTEEIRALILARACAADIRRTAIAQGMRTLEEDGLAKVRAGETTRDEVARVIA
jgi:type IV pilus assembly protein PilB